MLCIMPMINIRKNRVAGGGCFTHGYVFFYGTNRLDLSVISFRM